MVIKQGEKFHVVMRRNYESQIMRHFAGEVEAAIGAVVRAKGVVFIYDESKAQYVKKVAPRTKILNLSDAGYIVNLIPSTVDLDNLSYETIDRSYLAVTDGKGFILDINEFGTQR